ncbi:hypothetical protein CGRA01v4_06556 [Colletotrichum graminicola]|nr:hypothetical protein CGRA01v4_06556 [Colletotrichum graminicola]
MRATQKSLLQVLEGVATATKSPRSETAPIESCILSVGFLEGTFRDWNVTATENLVDFNGKRTGHLTKLVLAVSYLRESIRTSQEVTPPEIGQCWEAIRDAIQVVDLDGAPERFFVSGSVQGFWTITLCDLSETGHLDELFGLRVWIPHASPMGTTISSSSSPLTVHNWVLSGEGRNYLHQPEPVTYSANATHIKVKSARNCSEPGDDPHSFVPFQEHPTLNDTDGRVRVQQAREETYTRNSYYSLPAETVQRFEVDSDNLFSTFALSECPRGSFENRTMTGVPGGHFPADSPSPANFTSRELVQAVDSARSWEGLIDEGREHARKAEWEDALRAFHNALSLCAPEKPFPNARYYKHLALGEIGSANRRFGRYKTASDFLEEAINGLKPCLRRVEFSGELGVTYSHIGQLEHASNAFTKQYEAAKEVGADREICRAVGNMGMLNFRLSQRDNDQSLLDLAITQLQERVDLAEDLRRNTLAQAESANSAHWLQVLETWKTIGLCRLSLCHCARGNVDKAIAVSAEALEMTALSRDVTVKAMTRFFHGRALVKGGRREEALRLYNIPGTCSPAIAFAKEPSEENRGYLQELADIGADFDIVDEQGYTALDHAVFSGDVTTESIILEGLRKVSEDKARERQTEARLRKGYRELFQDKLRPVLLSGGLYVLSKLRKAYAEALATDETKRSVFDGLNFMWYSDFLDFKRLPRSDDGLVREFNSNWPDKTARAAEKVVFISYRWINKTPGAKSPDDDKHTQYRRMIDAIEHYLRLNPSVHKDKLGIWMDHACVNQDDPNTGVSALPMIIAQCDAMISLVDEDYYDRGWCAVEVMMAETLRSSYSIHQWYEHVVQPGVSRVEGVLREAPDRPIGMMKDKRLTFETDRPKVLFLERQSKLLG